MGVVMLRHGHAHRGGAHGSVFQMFAHGIMTGLFFALVGLVYEKSHSRESLQDERVRRMMPGIATAFTIAGLPRMGCRDRGFVAELLTFLGAWHLVAWWLFPGVSAAYRRRSTCCG